MITGHMKEKYRKAGKGLNKLEIPERNYRKCNNCHKTESETFIHINGLCVVCQLIKDKKISKKNKDKQ